MLFESTRCLLPLRKESQPSLASSEVQEEHSATAENPMPTLHTAREGCVRLIPISSWNTASTGILGI